MSQYSYVGKGTIYGGLPGGKLRAFGNASALTLGATEETNDLRDFTNPGGGLDDFVTRISDVTLSATLHDISPENLALAFFGQLTEVVATSVTGEDHIAQLGGLVRLDNLPDQSDSAVFAVTDQTATTTYVEGTDYQRTAAGLIPLAGGGIADGDTILVDYDKRASAVVQALTKAAENYQLVFEGLNEAKSGRPVVVDVHLVKFGPAQNFGLIADEFAGLEIAGRVLKDSSKAGDDAISQYFKAEIAA